MKRRNQILKEFTKFVNDSDLSIELIQLVKYMFSTALDDYIKSDNELKKNGYFVESYTQKYLNPAVKLKNQSFKQIIKIIQFVSTNKTLNPKDDDLLKSLLMID